MYVCMYVCICVYIYIYIYSRVLSVVRRLGDLVDLPLLRLRGGEGTADRDTVASNRSRGSCVPNCTTRTTITTRIEQFELDEVSNCIIPLPKCMVYITIILLLNCYMPDNIVVKLL